MMRVRIGEFVAAFVWSRGGSPVGDPPFVSCGRVGLCVRCWRFVDVVVDPGGGFVRRLPIGLVPQ